MMIESSSKGYEGNQQQEGENNNYIKIEKVSSKAASTSSRAWSNFRNPRIVRVSRSLGGKDRHSKVCTIRGLRDRRIRLSVPTAIQLYDLQDRLGLNQPSKVVDWLLEATKSDIDKLPPLQIPHCFAQFHQQTLLPPGTSHHLGGLFYDANINQNLMPKSRYLDIDSLKGKELLENVSISQKGKEWIKTNEQENQKLFPFGSTNSFSLPGLLNNGMTYNNSYHHSEPSNLSLSQFGSHGLFPSSSSLSLPCGSQLLFCPPPPPSGAAPSAFYSVESDPRQSNNNNNNNNSNVQILSSSSQVMMPHPLIQSFHSINSPLRRLPMPFSSKLLDDSDNHNNRSSIPEKD